MSEVSDEASSLDTTDTVPSCYVLVKVSIETFGQEPKSDKQMWELSEEFASAWSQRFMTSESIITYEATPLDNIVYLGPKAGAPDETKQ